MTAPSPAPAITLLPMRSSRDKAQFKELFFEFQALMEETNPGLPYKMTDIEALTPASLGPYAAPDGIMFLAHVGDQLAGCCGAARFDEETVEIKRMYVRPRHRGLGLGSQLLQANLDFARQAGYRRVLLDSLKKFTSAHTIYRAAGFIEIPPYNPFPPEYVLFFSKDI